jgi:hypothetical protein
VRWERAFVPAFEYWRLILPSGGGGTRPERSALNVQPQRAVQAVIKAKESWSSHFPHLLGDLCSWGREGVVFLSFSAQESLVNNLKLLCLILLMAC